MKNKNVFIWGFGALLVTTYSALASDATTLNTTTSDKAIENNFDATKEIIHQKINALQIPSIVVFDRYINDETGELKEDYIKEKEEIVEFLCKSISELKKQSSLINIMTTPTELSITIQRFFEHSAKTPTAIELIGSQVARDQFLMNNQIRRIQFYLLTPEEQREIRSKGERCQAYNKMVKEYYEAVNEYNKKTQSDNKKFLEKYSVNIRDSLKIYIDFCSIRNKRNEAFKQCEDFLKKYEKGANELKNDKKFCELHPNYKLVDFEFIVFLKKHERLNLEEEQSDILKQYQEYLKERKNNKTAKKKQFKKFLKKNKKFINQHYTDKEIDKKEYDIYLKYLEIGKQYNETLKQQKENEEKMKEYVKFCKEFSQKYKIFVNLPKEDNYKEMEIIFPENTSKSQEAICALLKYKQFIIKHFKSLCQVRNCLIAADTTGTLNKALDEAIREQEEKYSSGNVIPIPSYYKDSDTDTHSKKFYGLNYGFLG